jgi:hypothetical protein
MGPGHVCRCCPRATRGAVKPKVTRKANVAARVRLAAAGPLDSFELNYFDSAVRSTFMSWIICDVARGPGRLFARCNGLTGWHQDPTASGPAF